MLNLAREVSGRNERELRDNLERSRVCIGLDPDVPGALLAARLLVRTLRRMPGIITLDPDGIEPRIIDEIVGEAATIDPDRPLEVARPRRFNVAVRLAPVAPRGMLRALPDLHGYRLVSGNRELRQRRPASALGCASVAAVVAGEIFKTTAQVRPPRGVLHRSRAFCPVTLTNRPEDGPYLPTNWQLAAMLLAIGAVGTGVALILSELPVEGALDLVDPERYAAENVGTYSIGGLVDGRDQPFKTDLAAAVLRRFESRCWHLPASDLPPLIDDGRLAWPEVMLTSPDSAEARRDAQRVRADRLIDGGTGGTMVGLHVVSGVGQPCLGCFFPPTHRSHSSPIDALARTTGLAPELLVRGTEILTDRHLQGLTVEQQAIVRPHLGKEICGLAPVGLSMLQSTGPQPSVPFVSLTTATLIVGRLVAQDAQVEPSSNFVQFDALAGSRNMTAKRRRSRTDCECVRRASTIAKIRAGRRAISPRPA